MPGSPLPLHVKDDHTENKEGSSPQAVYVSHPKASENTNIPDSMNTCLTQVLPVVACVTAPPLA